MIIKACSKVDLLSSQHQNGADCFYFYEMYTTDERIKPEVRQKFTAEDAKREAAADFFAEVLFKGKEYRASVAAALESESNIPEGDAEASLTALEELAQKDKNLFARLRDMVKRFISNLKGHSTNASVVRDLEKLESKLRDVYNSARVEAKENTAGSGVKYKISSDKKFEEYKKAIDYIESHEETSQKGKYIEVSSQTPEILVKRADAENLPMAIQFDIAYLETRKSGKLPGNYHNIGAENMKNIPQLLETPEYIVKLENGRLNVIISMETEKGDTALVSVELSQQKQFNGKFNKYNLIITVFGAKSSYLSGIINNPKNTIKYKKEADVQGTDRLHKSPDGINTSVSKHSIRQNAEKSQEKVSDNEKASLRGGRLDELRYRPEMFAKWLLRTNGSAADLDTVTKKVKEIIALDNKGSKEWDTEADGTVTKVSTVKKPINELARYIAEGAKLQLTDEAKEIRRMIRNANVYLDEAQIAEVKNQYRTVGEYRRETGLKFSAANNTSLDSLWQEWAEEYPNVFSPDTNSAALF